MVKYLPFALLFLGVSCNAVCPPASDLLPCTCTESDKTIHCNDIRGRFDIKALFDQISSFVDDDVVFNELIIRNTALLEIPAGSIQSLKFHEIDISFNENLEYISPEAFNATTLVTTILRLETNYISNPEPFERDIYDLVNAFSAIETFSLQNNRITSLPDRAFGSLTALRHIDLRYNSISYIGNSSFSQLAKLERLWLNSNAIAPEGVSQDAFVGIGAQVDIDLTFTEINYLPETSFKPLLDQSTRISVGGKSCGSSGVCSYRKLICDEEALWICQNETEYTSKLSGFLCLSSDYVDVWSYCAAKKLIS